MKKEVLDPQGKVVSQTLKDMGYSSIVNVRQGKYFDIKLDDLNKLNSSWFRKYFEEN